MFGKVLEYLNKNLGKVFFGNPNSFNYNLFNKYHLSLIAKKKTSINFIDKYINEGYFKTNINSEEVCKKLNDHICKQKIQITKKQHTFEINDEMKKVIRDHINNDFKDILNQIEYFYNSKISVAKIRIARNYPLENSTEEVYSNNYHVDHYTYNHFKLFINLMDTKIEHGPLHLYSKMNTKKFLKMNKYKNRSNYINKEINNSLIINSGKLGESMFVNTTQCLHKAGEVKNNLYRDMLFITFITIPEKVETKNFFYYEKQFKNSVWDSSGGSEILKIAKPKSLKKTIKLFLKYYNNKLN